MINKEIAIQHETGIHARPASAIAKLATTFISEIKLIKNEMSYDAKSIINILSMGMKKDEVVLLTVEGIDEAVAFNEMIQLFESDFGEKL